MVDRFQYEDKPNIIQWHSCPRCDERVTEEALVKCKMCGDSGCKHCKVEDEPTGNYFCGADCKNAWVRNKMLGLLVQAKEQLEDRIVRCKTAGCYDMYPCYLCKAHKLLIMDIEIIQEIV